MDALGHHDNDQAWSRPRALTRDLAKASSELVELRLGVKAGAEEGWSMRVYGLGPMEV